MVSDVMPRRPGLKETLQMRLQAKDLLDRLMADRESSERRLAESGKRDPMRAVTGQTAFDGAIASAKQMLAHIDTVLAELGHTDGTVLQVDVPAVQFPARRVFKPQVRHPARLNPIPVSVITRPAGLLVS